MDATNQQQSFERDACCAVDGLTARRLRELLTALLSERKVVVVRSYPIAPALYAVELAAAGELLTARCVGTGVDFAAALEDGLGKVQVTR